MRIQINNLSHDYAGTPVLSGVTATITTGEHIGVVGANGCGKTTLVRLLAGTLEPAGGSVTREPGTSVGYVPQTMEPGTATTVGAYLLADVLAMRERLRDLEFRMGDEPERLEAVLRDYETVRDRYDAANGDTAEETAERLLGELGLPAGLEQRLDTLSGGEQNVLALARAVIARPDLLILDEPGNHLDFAGLAWLEEYLRAYPGAVCVVSHNRYLLDRVAQTIWEIDRGRLTEYTGNYSDYRFAKLQQALSDQATWAVQQQKLARLEELVRTFEERARVTGDPRWGKRLRARRTQLEKAREGALDQPRIGEQAIEISFNRTNVRADIAVEIRGYRKAFGERELFRDASLMVHVGARVGMVGPNGSGKTTLVEELVSRGHWDDPVLRVGPSMRIGYCAQKRGRFPEGMTVLDAMLTAGSVTRKEVFGVLGRLRFAWEDLDRPVGSLSGGEWNRLQLATAILAKANLLILDEPTNHLDIPGREAVEEALAEFDGTIIAVSHDRYFLDAVATTIVELRDLLLVSHDGGFSEFFRDHGARYRGARTGELSRRRQAVGQAAAHAGAASRGGPGDGSGASATEERIVALESEREQLEERMAASFAAGNYREGRRVGNDLAALRKRIDELYEQWAASG